MLSSRFILCFVAPALIGACGTLKLDDGLPPHATGESFPGAALAICEGATCARMTLTPTSAQVNVVRGSDAPLIVTVDRAGSSGPLKLSVEGLPAGVSSAPVMLAEDASTAQFSLQAAPGAALGVAQIRVSIDKHHSAPVALLVQDASGTVDTTFGTGGIAHVAFHETFAGVPVPVPTAGAGQIVERNGRIWVSATPTTIYMKQHVSTAYSVGLARLMEDGATDTAFGSDGSIVVNGPGHYVDEPATLAVSPSGRAFVTGFMCGACAGNPNPDHSMVAAAFTVDGAPDPSFANHGFFVDDLPKDAKSAAAALQPDGRLIVAGWELQNVPTMFRLTTDGKLDPTFGDGGRVRVSKAPLTYFFALGFQSNGAIVAALGEPNAMLTRFSPDGTQDTAYGKAGWVEGPKVNDGQGIVVQGDDKVVLMVGHHEVDGLDGWITLTRYQTDGSLDPTFGNNGTTMTPIAGDPTAAWLRLSPDGRLAVTANVATGSGTNSFTCYLFTTGGSLQKILRADALGVVARGIDVTFDPYGRILVVGDTGEGDKTETVVARFWP
jgi:uncharacterized delta-60 repeat protein